MIKQILREDCDVTLFQFYFGFASSLLFSLQLQQKRLTRLLIDPQEFPGTK